MEKPKRPLSAFNLFYKYKRVKILEARSKNCDGNEYKDIIQQLVNAMPGLEEHPACALVSLDSEQVDLLDPEQVKQFRKDKIRSALHELLPHNTSRRVHRKSLGVAITFVEMK